MNVTGKRNARKKVFYVKTITILVKIRTKSVDVIVKTKPPFKGVIRIEI